MIRVRVRASVRRVRVRVRVKDLTLRQSPRSSSLEAGA